MFDLHLGANTGTMELFYQHSEGKGRQEILEKRCVFVTGHFLVGSFTRPDIRIFGPPARKISRQLEQTFFSWKLFFFVQYQQFIYKVIYDAALETNRPVQVVFSKFGILLIVFF